MQFKIYIILNNFKEVYQTKQIFYPNFRDQIKEASVESIHGFDLDNVKAINSCYNLLTRRKLQDSMFYLENCTPLKMYTAEVFFCRKKNSRKYYDFEHIMMSS